MDFEFKKKICEQSKFVKVTDYPEAIVTCVGGGGLAIGMLL